MNEQFTPELLTQARAAETPEATEALLTLAAENGVTLTPEEAQTYFNQLRQTGELADEELDNVAGGRGGGGPERIPAGSVCCDFHCKFCNAISGWYNGHKCTNGVTMDSHCWMCTYSTDYQEYNTHARPHGAHTLICAKLDHSPLIPK